MKPRSWLLPAIVAIAAVGAWAWGAYQPGFLGHALRSGLFVRLGLIVLASAAALAVIGRVLFRSGRPGRQARTAGVAADSDGTAVVEFALLFPVAVAVILIMIQAMLMMSATIMVHHAAFEAARTAVVWVPKDLSGQTDADYDPEPENVVADPPRSYKVAKIRAAAAIACLPISGESSSSAPGGNTVRNGIEGYFNKYGDAPPNWVGKLVKTQFAYAWNHTRVVLDDWYDTPNTYQKNQEITVWVYHEYNLSIPFANALFAQRRDDDGQVSTIKAYYTLINEGVSDVIQEDKFN